MGTGANNRQLSLIHMRRYFSLPSCFLWKHNAPLVKRNHSKRWNDKIKPTLPTLRKMRFYRSAVCSPHIRITHPAKAECNPTPTKCFSISRTKQENITAPPPLNWIVLHYLKSAWGDRILSLSLFLSYQEYTMESYQSKIVQNWIARLVAPVMSLVAREGIFR